MPDNPILPAHIEQTIETIAELHRQHQRRATPSQKVVAQLTAAASQPRFVGLMTLVFVLWIGANGFARLAGYAPPDPPPFSYIQAVTGIAGVYVTLLILITQRRENQLSEARDQLTLELAIVNEQKTAKIIALLEEMRRDLPNLPDRADPEAEQLSTPADPQAVLDALHTATEELLDSLPVSDPAPSPSSA
ncbi:MAG: DUF1003 domain-containing protein [Caulobacteraceae bacterium]